MDQHPSNTSELEGFPIGKNDRNICILTNLKVIENQTSDLHSFDGIKILILISKQRLKKNYKMGCGSSVKVPDLQV
jgi:hypothetical protein